MAEVSKTQQNVVNYIVVCVSEFADRYGLEMDATYIYLRAHGGIDYLEEFYDVLSTMSFDDAVDGLTDVCRNNGGEIS